VYAFEQEVGRDQHFLVGRIGEYGGIVADAVAGRFVFRLDTFGQMVYEAKLAEGSYFCSHLYLFIISNIVCLRHG